MIRQTIAAAAMLALFATPALADPNCLGGGSAGVHISMGVGIGQYTEAEQAMFDKMHLRQRGINADTAERTWLGCLKVTRREGGRWVTEYYDPDSLQIKADSFRLKFD